MYWCLTRTGLYLSVEYCITCLDLLFSNHREQVYIWMAKMLDLRIGIELWSTLDQWDAPLWRAQRREVCSASWPDSLPWTVNMERCICGMLTIDM